MSLPQGRPPGLLCLKHLKQHLTPPSVLLSPITLLGSSAYLLIENIWLNSGFTASLLLQNVRPGEQVFVTRVPGPQGIIHSRYPKGLVEGMANVSPQECLGLKPSFWSLRATGCGQGTCYPRVTDEPAEAAACQGDTRGPAGSSCAPSVLCSGGTDRQSVPGLNSCCQGLRGTSSPALVAGTLVHSCAEALRGWGAVGALRKAGPSPPHTAAWMQGCTFQSRRCPGRAQGRKAGASEGAVTPLGLGWDVPGSALTVCAQPEAGLVWSPHGGEGRGWPRIGRAHV